MGRTPLCSALGWGGFLSSKYCGGGGVNFSESVLVCRLTLMIYLPPKGGALGIKGIVRTEKTHKRSYAGLSPQIMCTHLFLYPIE